MQKYVYVGVPVSITFRFVILHHGIRCLRTCCFFLQSQLHEGNEAWKQRNYSEAIEPVVHLSERNTATRTHHCHCSSEPLQCLGFLNKMFVLCIFKRRQQRQLGVSVMEVVVFKVIHSVCSSDLNKPTPSIKFPTSCCCEITEKDSFTFLSYVKQYDVISTRVCLQIPKTHISISPPGSYLHNT